MLRIEDLKVNYGPLRVLQGISLGVTEREIVALIGGNAAGKTTTLRAVAGLAPTLMGKIVYKGLDITALAPHERVNLGIAFCGAERQLFPEMTVLENLEMGVYNVRHYVRQFWDKSIESVYELFPVLKTKTHQRASSLSGGEQKMVAIGRALLSQPKLLMLDEPSLGLSPQMVDELGQAIATLNKDGLTILIAEQNLSLAMGLSDRVYLLERGKILKQEILEEEVLW